MTKRIVTAVLTITAGILAGVLLAVAGHDGSAVAAPIEASSQYVASPQSTAGSEIPIPDAASSQPGEGGYYIKDYKGRVAVMRSGSDTPEMIFDIHTKMLPELDRSQLSEGIYVASYEEMLRQVEDYIS